VRLERERKGRNAATAGFVARTLQQRAVAAVHAIEVADRDDATGERRRHRVDRVGDERLQGKYPSHMGSGGKLTPGRHPVKPRTTPDG
jgi:hypothetical protein